MKKYIIIIIALLFSLSVAAQRKTVTDKLQVTSVKNAEILSTDSKGNLVAGTLPEIPEGKTAETIYKETWVDDREIFDRTDHIVQRQDESGMSVLIFNLNTTYLFDGDTYLYPARSIYLKTSRNCVLKILGVENGDTPITANEWVDIMPYLQGNYLFYGTGNSIINYLKTKNPFPVYLTFDSVEDMNIEVAVMTKNEGITSIAKKILHINSVITEVPKKAYKADLNNFILTVSPKLDKIDKLATDVSNNFVRINEAFDEFSPFHAMFDEWRSVSFGNSEEIAGVKNILGTEVARLEGLVSNTGKVKTVNNIAPDSNGNVTIPINTTSSGLEKITQNGKTGWRLAGVDASKYVEIGENAVDLSHSIFREGGLGSYSFTSGYDSKASGDYSSASGKYTKASGSGSFATGDNTIASGVGSFATGIRTAANGSGSFASGFYTTASGISSFASGNNTIASGSGSFASGNNTIASGSGSFASGTSTTARGNHEFAIGGYSTDYTPRYNGTDRAFVIGNGTDENRSDALIVYKNGNMDLNGLLKLKPMAAPATPEKGMIYFDSTDNKLKCYDGTVWQNLW